MPATQAIAFLNTIGAKKPNLYERAGRKPRLSWELRGKRYGLDVEPHDRDSGEEAIPKIREMIAKDQRSLAAKTLAASAAKDFTKAGVRLKHVREEATLTRKKLAEATDVPAAIIKELEDKKLAEFDDYLDDQQLIIIAHTCGADPNWLANREIVPPEPEPEQPVSVEELATPILESEYAAIGARIRERREALGMSQVHLGELIDYSGVTVLNVEKGRKSGAWKSIAKIATALNTTEYKLRTGREEGETVEPAEPAAPVPAPVALPAPPAVPYDYVAVGERIRIAREAKGYNQSEFAELLGVSINPVSAAERGRNNVVFQMLDEVAEHLECTEEWLDTGKGPGPAGWRDTRPPEPRLLKAADAAAGRTSSGEPAVTRLPVVHRAGKPGPRAAASAETLDGARLAALIQDVIAAFEKRLERRFDQMAQLAVLRHEQHTSALAVIQEKIEASTRQITEIGKQVGDIAAKQEHVLRYSRAIYRSLEKKEPNGDTAANGVAETPPTPPAAEPQPPAKKVKNPNAIRRGHSAIETRLLKIMEENPELTEAEARKRLSPHWNRKQREAEAAAPEPTIDASVCEPESVEPDPIAVMAVEGLEREDTDAV